MRRHSSQTKHSGRASADRSGTAAVELAVTLPLFLTLVLGIAEMGAALDASQRLSAAVREGARAAASDLSDRIPQGQTVNGKVIQDIKNMLAAGGMDSNDVTITITHADGASEGQTFDLEDPDNYLKYFKVSAEIDYGDVGMFPPSIMAERKLSASAVFRMGYTSSLSE